MTTAHAPSLTLGVFSRAAKSVMAKAARPAVKVRCMTLVVAFISWLKRLHRNQRSRQELAHLDARLLADIGITETQRQNELRKPFWNIERSG